MMTRRYGEWQAGAAGGSNRGDRHEDGWVPLVENERNQPQHEDQWRELGG